MRPKSLMLLVLALGCGLVASIGISQVMDRNTNRGPQLETAKIYVALHNINLGDPIEQGMVKLEEWPKDKVPPGVISKLEDLAGRRPRTAIIQGEPILEGKLLAKGEVADPISHIPTGFRLKTIKVDAATSAAGLLNPGDRVDVQLYVKRDERNGIMAAKSKTILQNIRVFAIDQTVKRTPDGDDERAVAKTISLLLTPKQASKLSLAERLGEVSLIPRNPNDDDASHVTEFSIEELFNGSDINTREEEQARDAAASGPGGGDLLTAIQEHKPPPVPPFVMEVIEAHDVREMFFDADTGKPIREMNEPREEPQEKLSRSASGPMPDGWGGPRGDADPVSGKNAEEMLDDFPVDFEHAR